MNYAASTGKLTLSALLLVGLAASPAFAQAPPAGAGTGPAATTPQDIALAESSFNEGIKLALAGNCKDAVGKLELSQKIDPASGTAFNLGKCYEQLGRTASAYGAYSEAAGLARVKVNEERRKDAEERMIALEPLLPKIQIHVASPPNGLAISIDGKQVAAGAVGAALPVDPGNREIQVSAPGKKPWKTSVLVASQPGTTPVDVPALEDLPPPPPPSSEVPMPLGAKVSAIGLAGAGAVLLGVGIGFGVDALGKNADSKKLCLPDDPNKCSQPGVDLRDQAFSSATVSNVGIFAGLGLLAASGGVLLVSRLVLQKPAAPPAKNETGWTSIGVGPGGVAVQGVW